MFSTAARIAATAALCSASLACSALTTDQQEPPPPEPEVEVGLSLSIEEVDVRHGTVRIAATMEDGSPDVSVFLGSTCDAREIGHGIATRTSFVWRLTKDELSRAIECSLVVKVRALDEDGARVRKVAGVEVAVTFAAEADDDAPVLRSQETKSNATRFSFRSARRATRLHAAGAVIGAKPDDDEALPGGPYDAEFDVPNEDVAHCVIARRPLVLLGTRFASTLRIGNVTYDGSEPEPVIAEIDGVTGGDD